MAEMTPCPKPCPDPAHFARHLVEVMEWARSLYALPDDPRAIVRVDESLLWRPPEEIRVSGDPRAYLDIEPA